MSLNCLTCQILQRTDSNNERGYEKEKGKESERFCRIKVDRSWSGNLNPGPYEQNRNDPAPPVPNAKNVIKKGHRRLNTIDTTFSATAFEADDGEPKLIRSCGMRRDWSFEDLRGTRNGKMRKELRVR